MIKWGKGRSRGGGWFALPPKQDKPTTMVRLAHSSDPTLFYDSNTAQWTKQGYTTWTAEQWQGLFGRQPPDNRKWEHFGYLIPLYDDDDPNKTR